eukprot:CAMPEP_0178994956 /NCGR_PEP_ID=MMETSP0795-20121207/7575_1 /TAXON_ID=88552 /ORGANISM="Amoebophrya sp., Strain Ameob2" /LENGTH=148 /DNA_ID=CAMNT_0020687241 /DNA_START=87 /DNA_END=533 /DNA_ORIENTATION=-
MGILSQALSWHQGDLALGLGAGIGGGMRSTISSMSSTSAVANSVVPRTPVHLPLQHAAPALSTTTPTCFYANHPTPRVLPAEPDDNILSAAQELQYTYGYREIKKKINAFASYAAISCLGALGIGYIASNLVATEASSGGVKKRKRAD